MDAEELSELKYSDLQALAKKNGVKANGGKDYLVQELATVFAQQTAPSNSTTTRSASKSSKRPDRGVDPQTEDEADESQIRLSEGPQLRRTRSGKLASTTPVGDSSTTVPSLRTRSRLVSAVAPRAALSRTTSHSRLKTSMSVDALQQQHSFTSPSKKKALDSQRRLGVGRPKAIGGAGVRKSTTRGKSASVKPPVVEVVVPTLQAVREEEAAAASRASMVKQASADAMVVEEDGEASTPPPPRHRQPDLAILPASSSPGRGTSTIARLSALEDRLVKAESGLEAERRRVTTLCSRVAKLETENRRLREDLTALQQSDSGAEKQVVSETPQTPSSRVPTPSILEKEIQQLLEIAAQPDPIVQFSNNTSPEPTTHQFPPHPSLSPKVLRPTTNPNSRSSSPVLPPRNAIPANVRPSAVPSRLRPLDTFGQVIHAPAPGPAIVPQSPAPAEKTLVKHARDGADSEAVNETGEAVPSANHSPKKRRRLNSGPNKDDIAMDGEPVNVDIEDATGQSTTLVVPERPVNQTRASSQPAAKGARGERSSVQASVEPVSNQSSSRRLRAGSAAPALARTASAVSTSTRRLQTVAEASSELNVAGPSNASQLHMSLAPIDPLPLPRAQDASIPPFISYPLPGDPVKELKPLTHFDSGTEFFGTKSKQNYRTDWHEGTVFDDPFDAETLRRAQVMAAEDSHGGFGPQGMDGIGPGLDEHDEEASLGARAMMNYPEHLENGMNIMGDL